MHKFFQQHIFLFSQIVAATSGWLGYLESEFMNYSIYRLGNSTDLGILFRTLKDLCNECNVPCDIYMQEVYGGIRLSVKPKSKCCGGFKILFTSPRFKNDYHPMYNELFLC